MHLILQLSIDRNSKKTATELAQCIQTCSSRAITALLCSASMSMSVIGSSDTAKDMIQVTNVCQMNLQTRNSRN